MTVKKRFQQKIVFQLMFETHFIYSKLLPVLKMKKNE